MNVARINLIGLPQLRADLALAAALLAVFVIHADTARSIVAIWNNSETFAHGYIILPTSLWLIWRRRHHLSQIPWKPFWPVMPLLAVSGFGWLLAELGDVQVVRQYAFVMMLPLTVLAIAGLRLAGAIAFPLFFLLLAVPFGEVFVPPLINLTADFTVSALQLTGIPVLRTGSNFEIPSGSWSVVEACSGVRYLISSFTLGCLYAYLTYCTLLRRLVFVLLSIAVPIVANGLRAYMIVIIGHLSDNRLAAGVDHLLYGWIFFGLVMFLMFWLGSYWREDRKEAGQPAPASGGAMNAIERPAFLLAVMASVVCVGIWPAYAELSERFRPEVFEGDLNRFTPQWKTSAAFTGWKHGFSPADIEMLRFFEHGSRQVGMSVLFYRTRRDGAGLISTANRVVTSQERRWQQVSASVRNETVADRGMTVREAQIHGNGQRLVVWYWYSINGTYTANDYVGKALLAKEKLLMRSTDGAVVMLFAPYEDDAEEARVAMRRFLDDHGALLGATLTGKPAAMN